MRLSIVAISLAAACAAPAQEFRPTDVATRARSGEPAAAYEVRDDSNRLAEVVLWSQGAYESEGATIVHVAAEVRNVGASALSIAPDALELEAFDTSGAPLSPARLVSLQPPGAETQAIAPSTARDIDVFFAVSPVAPTAIGSLRLRWGLVQPDGRKYTQFTDFIADAPRVDGYARAYVPIYGFYDPFFWRPRWIVVHHVPVRRLYVSPRSRRLY